MQCCNSPIVTHNCQLNSQCLLWVNEQFPHHTYIQSTYDKYATSCTSDTTKLKGFKGLIHSFILSVCRPSPTTTVCVRARLPASFTRHPAPGRALRPSLKSRPPACRPVPPRSVKQSCPTQHVGSAQKWLKRQGSHIHHNQYCTLNIDASSWIVHSFVYCIVYMGLQKRPQISYNSRECA